MLSIITSAALMGIDAWPVTVEVDTGECGEPNPVVVDWVFPLLTG